MKGDCGWNWKSEGGRLVCGRVRDGWRFKWFGSWSFGVAVCAGGYVGELCGLASCDMGW